MDIKTGTKPNDVYAGNSRAMDVVSHQKVLRVLSIMNVDLHELADKIDRSLEILYGQRMGFALICFEFNEAGVADYVSNCQRSDIIEALFKTAKRLQKKQDIPKPIGTA